MTSGATHPAMQYNRVGRTDIHLSAVGFGTFQLQLVPENQAIETLHAGFALGVNWVHTSWEYGGAEVLIARAVRESGRQVFMLNQASGEMAHFQSVFENTCMLLGRSRLAMFGINCIDDAEYLHHNVWGRGGMVEFLLEKKAQGRLGGIFCTTHGTPDYVCRLIRSGVFDAVMLAWNPLGFHVLSYFAASEGRVFENIPENREIVFPLAEKHRVSLLIMKPLAGGFLCRSKAFPPHLRLWEEPSEFTAGDVLRVILRQPGVCAVAPGTASVEEARENARAGYRPCEIPDAREKALRQAVQTMRRSLCSRCGACEATCSRSLRLSFLFRDAYIWNYRSESPISQDRLSYFTLHPDPVLACTTCNHRSCTCPNGIDIPAALARLHASMLALRERGTAPAPLSELSTRVINGDFPALVVSREVPSCLARGEKAICRFWIHNAGDKTWPAPADPQGKEALGLGVFVGRRRVRMVPLRHAVAPGERTFVSLEFSAPARKGRYPVAFCLLPVSRRKASSKATPIDSVRLPVGCGHGGFRIMDRLKKCREISFDAARGVFRKITRRGSRRKPGENPPAAGMDAPSPQTEDASGYGVEYLYRHLPERISVGTVFPAMLALKNTGTRIWRQDTPEGEGVNLAVHCGPDVVAWRRLPRFQVEPGDTVTFHFPLKVPPIVGPQTICLELIQTNGIRFRDRGVLPLTLEVPVSASPNPTMAVLSDTAVRINPWFYQPTEGISRSRDGLSFPILVTRAEGCRLWDAEGREYIDYIMGWGSTLLGYADPRIQHAIGQVLHTAAVAPFPHPLEMEVSRMLTEDFPGAEMVIFGKNGSDVCTLAARLARIFTGKKTILYCGYHGWQDFWVEQWGFSACGVPDRPTPLIHGFKFNDADDFLRLYHRHREDLAAVMIEPSGPWGGNDAGPHPDADVGFLGILAKEAAKAGALLVFDEIVTGYRYPGGSVQKAAGVVPDLTCLGKALASGMPLSALVGRAAVFQKALPQAFYCPTFKGDVYAFAAARAAMEIYRMEPVATHVWHYGLKLKAGIDGLCRETGIKAQCKGPPFRMAFIFEEKDPYRSRAKRTLIQQELLKQGIVTFNGIMLPSYAHDAQVLAGTLAAFGRAMEVVAAAEREKDFDRYLEIPLLP